MNKAAIAGIIAAVAIGIGIALAFSSGILETSTITEEIEDLPTQTEQPFWAIWEGRRTSG